MNNDLEKLGEDFALLDDWEGRYSYLIDLGRQLEPMPEALKTPITKVEGCTSQVWLVSREENGRFYFVADSDAAIVKGLIYVLLAAYNGKSADEIKGVDIEQGFSKLGLDAHISPNRRNGFFAMVERIKALAA